MSRTKKWTPKNGQFKNLRSNKKRRIKDRQETKVTLTKYVQLTNRKSKWDDDETQEENHKENHKTLA